MLHDIKQNHELSSGNTQTSQAWINSHFDAPALQHSTFSRMKQNTTSLCFCFGSKCSMWQTAKQNRRTFAIVLPLLLYFMVMDILLYKHVQEIPPVFRSNWTTDNLTAESTASVNEDDHKVYSPFEGISVKMMMMDQPNDYIHIPMATIFNKVTHFSEIFYFITPNMISLVSILPALLSAKFVTSNILLNRQIGVLLFEFRNFMDALDGAVYRSRQHLYTFVTNTQSLGGVVDGIADVISFVAFGLGCLFYLKKNPARNKSYNQNGGLPECSDLNGCSAKQSALHAMAAFGFHSVYAALAWNIYVARFHNTLESPMPTQETALLQNLILKSNCTWIFMWLWRLVNSHGLFEVLSLFIFIDKLTEFVAFMQSKGILLVTSLIVLTELYYMDTKYLIETMSQSS